MSNEMEGVSLARSGGDHRSNHEEKITSRAVVVVEDLGDNSNGSSSEGIVSGRDEVDGEIIALMSSSSKDKLEDQIVDNRGSHHHHHHHHHHLYHRHNNHHNNSHSNSSSSHNHHRNNSRANYCQFETPADESRRGTFPDDFDEDMFINTSQLVESKSDPPQFDEEMDSSHPDSGLNLDTADHSESSDIDDIYSTSNNSSAVAPTSTGCSSTTTTTATNNNNNNGSNIPEEDNVSTSCFPINTLEKEADEKKNPMQEDLIMVGNNINKGSSEPKKRVLVDESYNQEEPDDYCVNESEEKESNILFASSVRKRKWIADELLPAKKPVTECDADGRYKSFLVPESEDEFPDEDVYSVAPSPSIISDTNPSLLEWLNMFANWSPVERLTAINHLIQSSEPSEVRHMMRVIEPQFQRDFISLLPKELALYVLSFLEPKDLLQAAQTCRYWRILCDDSLLWKEKCREAGIGPFSAVSLKVPNRRSRTTTTTTTTTTFSPGFSLGGIRTLCPGGSDSTCNSSCEPWKAAFLRQHNVEMNWRFQPIRPAKTLKGHDDHVITCLQFSANRIVSGSDDNTLKVWSATTGKCLRTLIGHTGGVWSSQMSGTTIVSGSTDRTLRVWNADTGTCIHTLYGHTSTVRCMHLYDRKVVSGSRDATLRVWNVDTGECLHVLVGHLAAVRCVQYNGKIVVSGAYDYMVRVWDVEREECLHQLSGHTNRVYSLQFDGIHVVSGSLDTSIRVWDVQTGTCRHTLMGHQSLTSGMELRDNLLVSGNADSTVKIWDINTGQCLLTLSGTNKHLSAVTCLQLINKFVITSSDDGTVKLWDISTGEFVRNLVTLNSGGSGGVVWRIRASETKLVCAVGSRNGTEETKLLVLDFDIDTKSEDNNSLSPIKCV